MQKWGTTGTGKQRYRCAVCQTSVIRRRRDNAPRATLKVFVRWLAGSDRLDAVARRLQVAVRTLNRRFRPCWNFLPKPILPPVDASVLIVDGVTIVPRTLVTLIAHEPQRSLPVDWLFVPRESYQTWRHLFQRLAAQAVIPQFVVCDGKRGLLKALFEVWPNVRLQRCLIHIIRQANAWLTQHPKTATGAELRLLVKRLIQVRTRRQKRRWIRAFRYWCRRHNQFLKERTYSPTNPKRWWYAHRKLRAVRSLLCNALNHLFTHIRYRQVPRTSNHLEGGVNSRLKDLLRIHRGLPPHRRQVLTSWYLSVRQGQKPTQDVH